MNLSFIEYNHTGLFLWNMVSSVTANSFATRLDKSDNSMFLTFQVKRERCDDIILFVLFLMVILKCGYECPYVFLFWAFRVWDMTLRCDQVCHCAVFLLPRIVGFSIIQYPCVFLNFGDVLILLSQTSM